MNGDGRAQFDEGFGRRREHANIEAMQNLIIDAVTNKTTHPMPPLVRNFVSALQSSHGGGKAANEPFTRSHIRVASYMQFKGERAAKEQRVRRLINRLEEYKRKTGYLFFLIKRGGEIVGTDERGNPIYSATCYTDFLKPVADAAVQRARTSELWKRNPGDALAAQVAWALAQLPPVDERPEEKGEGSMLPLAEYERQSEEQIRAAVEKRADGIAQRGGDVNLWLERLEVQISRLRRSHAKTAEAERRETMREQMDAREAEHRALDAEMVFAGEGDAPPTTVTPPPAANPSLTEDTPDMFAAAQSLAAKGFRVFPLHWIKADGACSCPGGADCKSPGKHPRFSHWKELASTEEGFLKGWFKKQWPGANVGILTGEPSGLCVIDFDFDKGGEATMAAWRAEHGDGWLDTRAVRTGGGIHLYFQYPQGVELRNTTRKIGEGVDTRASGGFVVAPPSLHASGRRYEWLNDLETAPLPEWLLKLLTEDRAAAAAPSGAKARPQARSGAVIGLVIAEGERNDTLFKIGCSLRGKGAELPEIEAELLDINARRCSPALPESEVLKIARSSAGYAANRVAVGV